MLTTGRSWLPRRNLLAPSSGISSSHRPVGWSRFELRNETKEVTEWLSSLCSGSVQKRPPWPRPVPPGRGAPAHPGAPTFCNTKLSAGQRGNVRFHT